MIDTAVLVLPVKIIYTLQISWQKKLQVIVIFSGAMLVLAAGAVRVYEVHIINKHGDFTWNAYTSWVWVTVEQGVGIICGSLPACSVLLKVRDRAPTTRRTTCTLKPYMESSTTRKTSAGTEDIGLHAKLIQRQ
jgi:hypothetical protein